MKRIFLLWSFLFWIAYVPAYAQEAQSIAEDPLGIDQLKREIDDLLRENDRLHAEHSDLEEQLLHPAAPVPDSAQSPDQERSREALTVLKDEVTGLDQEMVELFRQNKTLEKQWNLSERQKKLRQLQADDLTLQRKQLDLEHKLEKSKPVLSGGDDDPALSDAGVLNKQAAELRTQMSQIDREKSIQNNRIKDLEQRYQERSRLFEKENQKKMKEKEKLKQRSTPSVEETEKTTDWPAYLSDLQSKNQDLRAKIAELNKDVAMFSLQSRPSTDAVPSETTPAADIQH